MASAPAEEFRGCGGDQTLRSFVLVAPAPGATCEGHGGTGDGAACRMQSASDYKTARPARLIVVCAG